MLAVGQMDGSRQSAFLLNTPPLAALHSMTEMKTPLYPAYPLSSTGPASSTSPTATSPNPGGIPVSSPGIKTSSGLSTLASLQHYSIATPHGINDILSRPAMVTGAPATVASSPAGILSGLPRFSSLSPPPPPGLYFSPVPRPWRWLAIRNLWQTFPAEPPYSGLELCKAHTGEMPDLPVPHVSARLTFLKAVSDCKILQ